MPGKGSRLRRNLRRLHLHRCVNKLVDYPASNVRKPVIDTRPDLSTEPDVNRKRRKG
jgi:hypothetical protein